MPAWFVKALGRIFICQSLLFHGLFSVDDWLRLPCGKLIGMK